MKITGNVCPKCGEKIDSDEFQGDGGIFWDNENDTQETECPHCGADINFTVALDVTIECFAREEDG